MKTLRPSSQDGENHPARSGNAQRRTGRKSEPSPRRLGLRPGHASPVHALFERFANKVTSWTGSPLVFGIAFGLVLVWAITGPFFGYSETWQLVINTGTTIVTFLMVFLIQQSQNKDSHAVHLKLDELLCAIAQADNRLVHIEELDDAELDEIADRYRQLAERARAHRRAAQARHMGDEPAP
ncbi:low affinity iron permease family protein [Achromobacter aloeverae]|uniref:Low affinity iron permease family protein n=1 Tax=Achromobacter aloeverae TaxID=1750518 RepID=A0A4Q1HQJ5_9BURK|nr:low affinity iron permease family protein [Achromobacter aloeverae]RXN93348.1 low affinity iron permease family protein [Achromobacter aloeverae]